MVSRRVLLPLLLVVGLFSFGWHLCWLFLTSGRDLPSRERGRGTAFAASRIRSSPAQRILPDVQATLRRADRGITDDQRAAALRLPETRRHSEWQSTSESSRTQIATVPAGLQAALRLPSVDQQLQWVAEAKRETADRMSPIYAGLFFTQLLLLMSVISWQ
eukprot:TRINITY_DN11222_c2_g1_i1.p1 TRINITY_DN11222_c2_g1~~TRINITY_DN11222_c2_g1_i1.p1  ORF type:complete len:161 (-),score=27.91 TRINITY_DN11222_c2_g1_i1:337-819(-)